MREMFTALLPPLAALSAAATASSCTCSRGAEPETPRKAMSTEVLPSGSQSAERRGPKEALKSPESCPVEPGRATWAQILLLLLLRSAAEGALALPSASRAVEAAEGAATRCCSVSAKGSMVGMFLRLASRLRPMPSVA